MSKSLSVIVIDDDEVFNNTLCRTFKRKGISAFSALNSEQALKITTIESPDCAVLDLCIGNEKGIDLVKPLLEIHPSLKIVVLTGYASLTTAVSAIKLGALDYLAKPVDIHTIIKALKSETDDTNHVELVNSTLSLKQLEWEHLQHALMENNGNITQTAKQLGMHRRTLQRKLQKRIVSPSNKKI